MLLHTYLIPIAPPSLLTIGFCPNSLSNGTTLTRAFTSFSNMPRERRSGPFISSDVVFPMLTRSLRNYTFGFTRNISVLDIRFTRH